MNKYSALDIAKWFIAKNAAENVLIENDEEPYEGISHLKLQKLLYYAQGIHLAFFGSVLFTQNIEAWEHGPVVRDVYSHYRGYGKDYIPAFFDNDETFAETINEISSDEAAVSTLETTYENFAIYTAWQLRNMTHADGSPWQTTVSQNGYNAVIDTNVIKEYFEENVIEKQ